MTEDSDRVLTPGSVTEIILNPKADGETIDLYCPYCEEEIEAWSGPQGELVEYQCGCDKLRKFRIRGE